MKVEEKGHLRTTEWWVLLGKNVLLGLFDVSLTIAFVACVVEKMTCQQANLSQPHERRKIDEDGGLSRPKFSRPERNDEVEGKVPGRIKFGTIEPFGR